MTLLGWIILLSSWTVTLGLCISFIVISITHPEGGE